MPDDFQTPPIARGSELPPKTDQPVLWICPTCSTSNVNYLFCQKCHYRKLDDFVRDKITKTKREINQSYLISLGACAVVGLLIWGLGFGGFTGKAAEPSPVASVPTSPTPSPEPNPSPNASETPQRDNTRDEAIKIFLAKNYKGWKYQGISATGSDGDCLWDDESPCILYLSNERQDKAVCVFLREFRRENGHSYYVAYEATWFELAKMKAERFKEKGREQMREELN
jgi:hypothetical protein